MPLCLIKNPKGRIVSTNPARKKYLLDPHPVALKANGQPKEDNNGNHIPLIKSFHEVGWTDVTPEEVKTFEEELEADQEAAQEVADATRAASLATATAAQLSAKATKVDQLNANAARKPGRKSKKQQEEEAKAKEEMEAKVRDAEGDAAKYDELSDDEKALYIELFEAAPEGSK